MTRSFESTGPDVKLRGTPAHIAEKYIALARDALSSGDPVLAENYLQHAEHYNRIIMTYREQQLAQGGGEGQNGVGRTRPPGGFGEPVSMTDEFGEDDGEFGVEGGQPQAQFVQPSHRSEGQPRSEGGQRFEDRNPRHEGGGRSFQNRDRHDRGERGERGERNERFAERQDRGERGSREERFPRPERIERAERPDRGPQPDIGTEFQPRRAERAPVPHHEQPEFLRRPVRRPRREATAAASADEGAPPPPAPTPAVEGSD